MINLGSVEVRVFANFRQMINPSITPNPDNPFKVEINEGMTLKDLIKTIGIPKDPIVIPLVNGLRESLDYVLNPGDRVGLFPPIGGG